MKKIYMAVALAACALGASAQYTAESPYMEPTVANGKIFDLVIANEGCVDGLKAAGKTVNDMRVNEETRFLYVWDNTFIGADASFPGVGYNDMQFDGFPAFSVGTVGWSGAGFCLVKPGDTTPAGYKGGNTSHWNDNTRFHLAYCTPGTAPESIGLVIGNKDPMTGAGLSEDQVAGNTPAKIALGNPFNDNGEIYPAVGPAATADWQAIDISFSDIKKIFPGFAYQKVDDWTGNIVAVLGGATTGRALAIDCCYFYTPGGDSAVEGVEADNELFIGNSCVSSAQNGIEIYGANGMLVAKTAGNALAIDGLAKGIYVVKAGNIVKKIAK